MIRQIEFDLLDRVSPPLLLILTHAFCLSYPTRKVVSVFYKYIARILDISKRTQADQDFD